MSWPDGVDTTIRKFPRDKMSTLISLGISNTPILHLLPWDVRAELAKQWADACNERFTLENYSISDAYMTMMWQYKKVMLFSVMNEDNIRNFVDHTVRRIEDW